MSPLSLTQINADIHRHDLRLAAEHRRRRLVRRPWKLAA